MRKVKVGSRWVFKEDESFQISVGEIDGEDATYITDSGELRTSHVDYILEYFEERLVWMKRTRHGRSLGVELRGNSLDRVG